ncbi:MAG: DUF1538 domain-containing protein [Acidiferrobacterales bacterium]
MAYLLEIASTLLITIRDVLPILAVLFGFQVFVLRRPIPNLKRTLVGILYVVLGLGFFLVGLEQALFPLGKFMAQQLTDPEFIQRGMGVAATSLSWQDYKWVYLFAAAIGFAAVIAEPALIAVALKAQNVSGGAIHTWGLRLAVAVGVAIGTSLGAYRIVTGAPIHYFIVAGYIFVIIQTLFAPKLIVALAYDSGGVTTSTITVPLIMALGLGLASTVPGRSPLLDGFGLIAFAALFPIITVMGYAQISQWRTHLSATRKQASRSGEDHEND